MSTAEVLVADRQNDQASAPDAFVFVRQLARDLSTGVVELPSYPDAALSVQRVLADENVSNESVMRIIGAEPVLAARVMAMANSAAMNTSGRPAADLRTAVARLGFDALRSASIGFAVSQLRLAAEYRAIEQPMKQLWRHSVSTAAICHAIARRGGRFNPDTAMLAGLVSGVGRLYVLSRISRHPALFADAAACQQLVGEWHAAIAKALLEHWGMASEIVAAVSGYEDADSDRRSAATLTDVLAAGVLLADIDGAAELLHARLNGSLVMARLGLDTPACIALLDESRMEISTLRDALGHY